MWFFGNQKESQQAPAAPAAPAPQAPSMLPAHLDASKLHPLANLNQETLEYLESDSGPLATNSGLSNWSESLCYGTGTMYLLGLGIGGSYGFVEGMRKTSDTTSAKLRINSILNSVTRRGPYLGNTAGVLAIFYNIFNGAIDYARDGKHDDAGSLAAGALTGALFRASAGVKPMLISSVMLTGVAGAWCMVKRVFLPDKVQ